MIKVGFIFPDYTQWIGGLNYYKNLIEAIFLLPNRQIEPVIFTSRSQVDDLKQKFDKFNISIFGLRCLENNIFIKLLNKISKTIFNFYFLLELEIKKYCKEIKVFSHLVELLLSNNFIIIGWIPDFQHMYLTNLFPKRMISYRNKIFKKLIEASDSIILSSNSAFLDYKKIAEEFTSKVYILQFAKLPPISNFNYQKYLQIKKKYQLFDKYFYVPNQFWQHKNHITIIKALIEIKNNNLTVPNIVFSGLNKDYRNKNYYDKLLKMIGENGLDKNIKILGLIDYEEVFYLIRYSICVINPSLFEGWSTTVEEAKSIGKHIILSNINVHVEQAPQFVDYFEPTNYKQLADLLIKYFNNPPYYDEDKISYYINENYKRVIKFVEQYQNIVLSTVNKRKDIVNKN